MKTTALTFTGATGLGLTLGATGWGLVLVAAMTFVVIMLCLLSDNANARLCRLIAVFRGPGRTPDEAGPASPPVQSEAPVTFARVSEAPARAGVGGRQAAPDSPKR